MCGYRNDFNCVQALEEKTNNTFCAVSAGSLCFTDGCNVEDKDNLKIRLWKNGMYTVEMSLLMPLLLGIIVMLIYLGFYVVDREIIEEAAKESAIYAAVNYPNNIDMAENAVKIKFGEITSDKLIAVNNVSLSADREGIYIVVKAEGGFVIPVFSELKQKIFGSDMRVKGEGKGALTNPVTTVWSVKFIENIMNGED